MEIIITSIIITAEVSWLIILTGAMIKILRDDKGGR